MKKLIMILGLALIMAGCSSKPAQTPDSSKTETALYKAGAGSITEIKVKDVENGKGTAQFDTTYAGVIVDKDNIIRYVSFDVVQNKTEVNGEGQFMKAEAISTKKEIGDDYGMVKASSIGKEWYEQIAAFEEYLIGKNIEDILNMELVENKSTDVDLLAGCTIKLNGYLAALEKAYENASEAENIKTAALGSISSLSGKDVIDGVGSVSAETTFAFYALDEEGKMVYTYIDTAENKAEINSEGQWITPEITVTKKELKDNYGMNKASSIGKEWYEQIAALEEYALGKTVDEFTDMKVESGKATDTDLLAGCTMGISNYLSVIDYTSAYETEIK